MPLIHLGVNKGWSRATLCIKLLKYLKPVDLADVLAKKETCAEATAKSMKVRGDTPYGLRFCAFAMLDPDFYLDTLQICFSTRPGRHLHGHCEGNLTSVTGSCKFLREIVARKRVSWEVLKDMCRPFDHEVDMVKMGLVVGVDGAYCNVFLNDEHPRLLFQQKIVANLWRLLMSQLREHLRGFNHSYDGFPTLFIGLLDGDAAACQDQWAKWQPGYNAFVWKRQHDRS